VSRMKAYAVKAEVADPEADQWVLSAQKTMYGGKHIRAGDVVFVFSSDHMGGTGLIARGEVRNATSHPRREGMARQTPLVSLSIKRTGSARSPLGRSDLRPFTDWDDGRPDTELNFKLYRQATNKVVGLTEAAAVWLLRHF
jgi:hypothetical protein